MNIGPSALFLFYFYHTFALPVAIAFRSNGGRLHNRERKQQNQPTIFYWVMKDQRAIEKRRKKVFDIFDSGIVAKLWPNK